MTVAIGASGIIGIALEAVEGTYVAPTKFIPIRSESLQWTQDTVWRRVIKGHADIEGAADGNGRVEGDIEMEVFTDILPYLLQAARMDTTKTGAAAPFTYTFKPNHNATPNKTLSILVERNGQRFGYTGCVISSLSMSVDNGLLVCTMSILGRDEAAQGAAVAAFDEEEVIGAGSYDIRVPAGAGSADLSIDSFTFSVENGAEPQYRLNPTSPGARFISYGERSVQLDVERDFENRTEYDEFKALTAKAVSIRAASDPTHYVDIQMRSAIIDSYEVGLSGQGDLIRASVSYMGIYDPVTTESFQLEVSTDEDLTI